MAVIHHETIRAFWREAVEGLRPLLWAPLVLVCGGGGCGVDRTVLDVQRLQGNALSAPTSAPETAGAPSRPVSSTMASSAEPGTACNADDDCSGSSGLRCLRLGTGESSCACAAREDFDYAAHRCLPAQPGARPGDTCGPSGEGEIQFSTCDLNRGLQCVRPPPGLADAPATCQCGAGQRFSDISAACTGERLGERFGDPCGPVSEGDIPYAACNAQRGLICTRASVGLQDAPAACGCPEGLSWSEARGQCVAPGACSTGG